MLNEDVWSRSVPTEILSQIFLLLPLSDLTTVLLVCRRWLEVGEHPVFWKEVTMEINSENSSILDQILDIKRLSAIQFSSECSITEDHLKLIAISNIISIAICCNDLSHISPTHLTNCIFNMEKVNMNNTILQDRQLISIFEVFTPTQQTKLSELCMSNQNLSAVPSQTLTATICRLKTADIYDTQLTNPQVVCLFTQMSKETNLMILNISFSNLSTVPPTILADCVNKLQKVNLMCTKLTDAQAKAIFNVMCVKTQLVELNIHGNPLTVVSPGAISTAVARLRDVDISETGLTPDQLVAMLRVGSRGLVLKKLDVRYNEAVLEISEEVIREGEKHIENLFYSRFLE